MKFILLIIFIYFFSKLINYFNTRNIQSKKSKNEYIDAEYEEID